MELANPTLTNEQIQRLAPSAFAGQAYEKQSDRYAFVPTLAVIEGMRQHGYLPVKASQSRSRIEGKAMFTKHMVRFRSAQNLELLQVGDTTVEVVLVNSHDGTSAYELSLGAFRLACSNGMMVSEGLVSSLKIRHTGNILDRVLSGTDQLVLDAPKVTETIQQWKQILLTDGEQQIFAESALSLRFEDSAPVEATRLLQVRRNADQGQDLWSTFNRVQENVIRGGLRYYITPESGRVHRNRTREVKGIDQNIRLNRELWTMAQKLADMKKDS